MSVSRNVRESRHFLILFFACLLVSAPATHAGIGFRVSLTDSLTSNIYLRRPQRGISAFQDRALSDYKGARQSAVRFDSTYTEVTHIDSAEGVYLLEPMIESLDTYVKERLAGEIWKEMVDKRLKAYKPQNQGAGAGEGLAIDLPYRIKSKTFRRLFGGDNVGVRVQGNIAISGSLRRQKFDELQAANQRNTNTAFRIDMVQQFTITGKVGQKVEVKVDQNSERLFDFENSLKLTYTGDEDEIIQKVEAGNVNLNLGTKLATFSGKNTGLFGLKTEMKTGPLKMTGIASIERGQKNRQSPNQTTSRATFDEKQFLANKYFWLTSTNIAGDGRVIPNFRQNYRYFRNRQHIAVPVEQQITDIEVFVGLGANEPVTQTQLLGRAVAMQFYQDLFLPDSTFHSMVDANHVSSVWRRLDRTAYDVDTQLGFIRLNQTINSDQALACGFKLMGGNGAPADSFGSRTIADTNATGEWLLVLLRPPTNPQPTDSTWNLMFRQVYSLQAQNLDRNNFRLTIVRSAASGQRDEEGPPGQNETYLTFFHFDLDGQGGTPGPDGLLDDYPALIDWDRGELQFLDLRPFDPEGYWDPPPAGGEQPNRIWDLAAVEQATGDTNGFRAPYLYDRIPSQNNTEGSKWRLSTEFRGSSSVFDLGPLVLEGSEEVTLNGQPLQRGTDYTIDYLSGQLRILNEAAKAQGAQLEITYESGRVFQLDKTTLLGARAEYSLWEDSYIGGMLLYLNQKTLDRRVRIGNEPIRNTLYDANTSLKFTPNFLTRAVDALPLVSTNTGSELTVDGEVAKVFPNPNSLENRSTGDVNGLAYVDDFEGSRRSTPLGLQRRNWSVSSIPEDPRIDYHRGRLRWWNPNTRDQVPVKDVFPEREINSQVANTLQSLILDFEPDSGGGNPRESWGGVMRYLGEGYADQSRSQYLEFWIKLPPARQQNGKLVVDLGTISEDALPNDTMDSEDLPIDPSERVSPTREYGNGLLSPNEDTGLDGHFGADPSDEAWWNGRGNDKHGNPLGPVPSWDDWDHSSGSSDFTKINGTENNRNDEGGGYPDTEDLNDNNNLDVTNNYYSYTIEVSDQSPYIAGENPANNWRLFRIPITGDSLIRRAVGNPDLTNVRWARIYLTGFSEPVTLETVQMDIVSNEWLPTFTATDSTEYITPAVANTHENPGYNPPPGVQGEIDPITNLRQREQSLVLKINALDNDSVTQIPDEYFVAKNLYQEYNLLEYRHLKMFVHGGGIFGESNPFPDNKYQVILRLGQNYSDLNNNYYEIITTVKEGWHPDNDIDVLLNDLALLHPHRGENRLPITARYAEATDLSQPGDSIAIKGSPTMARIGFIAVGVRLIDKHYRAEGDEIWVDELRVSDIYKDAGTAAALNASLNLADFATVSGGYQATDADFHNVNTRINANQSSTNSWRGNTTLNLHKFYLERWGFRLPLTVGYTETNTTPRTIPGTDTRITPDLAPDSIKAHQQSVTYHVQYSKTGNSPNPLVRWTLEKLSGNFDYSRDDRKDYNVQQGKTERSVATASYSFPTSKGRGIKPIWWIQGIPIVNKLGNPPFYFKPTKLQVAANATRQTLFQANRPTYTIPQNNPDSVIVNQTITNSVTFLTSRSLNTGFAPFRPITLDFTRSYKGQLDSTKSWADLLGYDFGQNTEINQNFTSNYTPEFYRWLKPTLNYSASYSWANRNFTQDNQQSVANTRNFGTDFQLDFRSIFGGGAAGGGPRRSPREEPRRPEQIHKPEGEGGEQGAEGEGTPSDTTKVEAAPKPSPLASLKNVLTPLKKALFLFDPIAISYDNNTRHSQSGILGQARLPYQFGFSQNPGLDTAANTITVPSRGKNEDITARTGMRFTQNLRATYNYAHRTSETIAQQNIGSVEQSVFWFGKDPDVKAIPFADVTLDWSGLEKISFLSHVARTVSLSSGISQKLRENWSQNSGNVTSREYTRNWSPLLGINFSWKGDIDSQLRYTSTATLTDGVTQGNRSRATDNGISATLSYSLRTGFRLPLPFMHALHLQNQTTFALNGEYRQQKQETSDRPGAPYTPRAQTSSWSLQPNITYSFSSSVQGRAYVQVQQNKDEIRQSKNRLFEFGINVNIAIRG